MEKGHLDQKGFVSWASGRIVGVSHGEMVKAYSQKENGGIAYKCGVAGKHQEKFWLWCWL